MLSSANVTALMHERQRLTRPAGHKDYDELFRLMSPVHGVYWSEPGEAPRMWHRSDFDDLEYNNKRRRVRDIVKGRFQGGGVGYVCADELELFAGLYRKPLEAPNGAQMDMIRLFQEEGPMNVRYIKETTGMLVKRITPILHRLQEAFILFEDQSDNDSDRAYYLFEGEFPDTDITRYSRHEALEMVIPRFAKLLVHINADMLKSYYKLPMKEIQAALDNLTDRDVLIKTDIDGKPGYLSTEDYKLLSGQNLPMPEETVFLLHRSDFLVKAREHELKHFPKWNYNIVYYLLISGEIKGAVYGRFTFGPVYLDDVWLDISQNEGDRLRESILAAIYAICDGEKSPLQKYRGKSLGL